MKHVIKRVFWCSFWGVSLWGMFLPVQVLGAPPAVGAAAYCLIDRESGQFILGKNEDEQRPIASTTKIITALLAAEYAELTETATVSRHADQTAEYTAGFREGQTLTVEDALKGALMKSYNDAAVVLAEHVAGDEDFFAWLMTCKAFALGAVQTRFQNASGLPDDEHYSTAYELALLSRRVLENPVVARLVACTETTFSHPGYLEPLTLSNTNTLLYSYPGADGVKTGTTNAAGKCLIASATRETGSFIAVALHASDRAGDCKKLLDYGFSLQPVAMLDTTEAIGQATVAFKDGSRQELILVPGKNISLLKEEAAEMEIARRLQVPETLTPPVDAGAVVGEVQLWLDGHYVRSVEVRAKNSVSENTWADRLIDWLMRKIYDRLIHIW